jgi:Fis family transcriptional regulator, factor for inversion stimulation protein
MSTDRHGPKSDRQAEQDSLSALQRPLSDCVRDSLEAYFKTLGDHETTGLYQLVLREVEKPLLEAVLQHTDNNQSNAALVLSISRGTLRKKLKEHDL